MKVKIISDSRPIIKATLKGKEYNFLLDTGAAVGIIDDSIKRLNESHRSISIVDASGDEVKCPILNEFVSIAGKQIYQFVKSNIYGVQSSIKQQTGIWIDGIISYPQLQAINASLDIKNNQLIIE